MDLDRTTRVRRAEDRLHDARLSWDERMRILSGVYRSLDDRALARVEPCYARVPTELTITLADGTSSTVDHEGFCAWLFAGCWWKIR